MDRPALDRAGLRVFGAGRSRGAPSPLRAGIGRLGDGEGVHQVEGVLLRVGAEVELADVAVGDFSLGVDGAGGARLEPAFEEAGPDETVDDVGAGAFRGAARSLGDRGERDAYPAVPVVAGPALAVEVEDCLQAGNPFLGLEVWVAEDLEDGAALGAESADLAVLRGEPGVGLVQGSRAGWGRLGGGRCRGVHRARSSR